MPSSLARVLALVTCSALAVGGPTVETFNAAAETPAVAHHYLSGDFDGDGHRDLVVGAPGRNRFQITYSHLVVKGSHVVTVAPSSRPSEAMNFGTAFALGDFNGDGYSDLAVSAPQYTTATTVGAVFVYLGSKSGLHATPLTIIGPGTEDTDSDVYNVISLAAGDLNGDGRADLVVGSYYATRVYHGYAHGVTTKGATKLPERNTGYSGADSLAVGDFNDDHHLDLAVGREGGDVNTPGETEGQLDLFYGTAHSLSTTRHIIVGDQVGAKDYQDFGGALAVGDFNGDGQADLAAGVPGGRFICVLFGSKQGLAAKDRQILNEKALGVTGNPPNGFGSAVAAGRITADRFTDLVVGAPNATVVGTTGAGEVFVIHGAKNGLTSSHAQHITMASSGVPGSPGTDAGFGSALYVADVAGSSSPDVVIGAPTDSQSKNEAGYVVRLLGTADGVTAKKASGVGSTTRSARFGTGLA